MKPLRRLLDEAFDANMGLAFEFIQKRGSQLRLTVQTPTAEDCFTLNTNTTYERGIDSFIFFDPTQPTSIRVATTSYLGSYYLQNQKVTNPLVLTDTSFSFFSAEESAIFLLDFETHELYFVAHTEAPPNVSQETFICNGILCSSNHLLPISALLNTDTSLTNTTALHDFEYDYSRIASRSSATSDLAFTRNFSRQSTRALRTDAPEIQASLDRSGTVLFLSSASLHSSLLGLAINLSLLFETDSNMMNVAVPVLLPASSHITSADASVQVVNDFFGFTVIVSDSRTSEAYFVDSDVLASTLSLESSAQNQIQLIKHIPLGYRNWVQHESSTSQYIVSPGFGRECAVLKSDLLTPGDKKTFSTTVMVTDASTPEKAVLPEIFFGTSDGFIETEKSLTSNLTLEEALSLILHGQPVAEALRYRKQVLNSHFFPETALTYSVSRRVFGQSTRSFATVSATPKRISNYTGLVQVNGQKSALNELSYHEIDLSLASALNSVFSTSGKFTR